MKVLCIDIGNTSAKAAVFENNTILNTWRAADISRLKLEIGHISYDKVIISDVQKLEHKILTEVFGDSWRLLNTSTPLPFKIDYGTPDTLGADRIALVAAGYGRFPRQNVLVIDAGTCLTYDFIDSEGVFKGGAISPGLKMRFRAVHEFTSALPLVDWGSEHLPELIGKSTTESILSGIVLGLRHEVEQTIVSYSRQFEQLKVIITGGDVKLFEGLVKNDIFAVPNLLLEGLNQIAIYNENFRT